MSFVSQKHFGANIIFNKDGLEPGDSFAATLNEINIYNLRYPGGGIAEDQTWENGGLQKIFATDEIPNQDTDIVSIREFMDYAETINASVSIVIPTFQFYDLISGDFNKENFEEYISELEKTFLEYPKVSVKSFEIGNEYWGSNNWGSFSPAQYGDVANYEIPYLDSMIENIKAQNGNWNTPGIGVQAGVQWRAEQREDGSWQATGVRESAEILNQISEVNLEKIGAVVQHSYPDASAIDQKVDWAVNAMDVFSENEHISDDIMFLLSEFNVGGNTAVGVEQGYAWIESFSQFVSAGITDIDHWGITYDWLSNKLYDSRFPYGESNDGNIVAIATPAGQVFDIAENYLIGMSPDDELPDFLDGMITEELSVTSFSSESQSGTFFFNSTDNNLTIDLSETSFDQHYIVHTLEPADLPVSTWYDEGIVDPVEDGLIADARGDMNVVSGDTARSEFDLEPNQMLVVFATDTDANLVIEGAHNQTNPDSGVTNDLLVGAGGNDILRGHVGNDTLQGGGGKDVLIGGEGDDHLIASDEGSVLISDEGNDVVEGGDGNDLVVLPDGSGTALISGGAGGDLFLIGDGSGAYVTDLADEDHVGFWNIFEDGEDLAAASSIDGDDLVIDLPSGKAVFAGQADRFEEFSKQILDFKSQDEIFQITESYLNGLTDLQLEELFDVPGLAEDNEDDFHYLDTIDAVLERVEWAEHYPDRIDELEDNELEDNELEDNELEDNELEDNELEDNELEDNEEVVSDENASGSIFPPNVDDHLIPEDYENENDEDHALSNSAACFIATAAYGDRLHPDVVALRYFRDHYLKRCVFGRGFIRFYWFVGPKLARHVQAEDQLAGLVRIALTGFVKGLRLLSVF